MARLMAALVTSSVLVDISCSFVRLLVGWVVQRVDAAPSHVKPHSKKLLVRERQTSTPAGEARRPAQRTRRSWLSPQSPPPCPPPQSPPRQRTSSQTLSREKCLT